MIPRREELAVLVETVGDGVELPAKATPGAAGYDLAARIKVTLAPGERALVGTGLKLAIPRGFEAQIRPRSGLALKHGVTVLNTPGTIDSDYRGEVGVILINHGHEPFVIEPGMRIAQMVFQRVREASFDAVLSLEETRRGKGGFGSTGS